MADLNALLKDEPIPEASKTSKLDSIIASDDTPEPAKEATPLHWSERFKQNFQDANLGMAQLQRNVLPEFANKAVHAAQDFLTPREPAKNEAEANSDKFVSTDQFNKNVAQREADYQQKKKDAGMQTAELAHPSTWDVAGITGALANPINWTGPKGEAASALGRVALAARNGAIVSLWQPTAEGGDYWSQKLQQAKVGAVAGGLFGGAAEALAPALKFGAGKIRQMFGSKDSAGAASKVVEDTLNKAGIDQSQVPQDFKNAITDEVERSAKQGNAVDPQAIVRRTRAASVGLKLSDGSALQDPVLYAKEQKLRAVSKGDEISLLDKANQTAAINKLGEWGAGGVPGIPRAPNSYQTAENVIAAARAKDDALTSQINSAYKAVRESDGTSAKINRNVFYKNAMDQLQANKPALLDMQKAAPEVLQVMEEIKSGAMPLTVEQMTSLDKWLGRKAFSQAHGDISHSINIVRNALNDAPILSNLGQEAASAYQFAKGLARDRFRLLDKDDPHYIPAFKAAVEGADPDKFFQKYIHGNSTDASVKNVDKLLQFMPEMRDPIARTTMRNIQEHVVNGPIESGTFSESKLGSIMDDPAAVAKLEKIVGPNRTQELLNLRAAAADAFRAPRGTDVPSYKTGKSLAGLSEMAGNAADYVLPGKVVMAAKVIKGAIANKEEAEAGAKATQGVRVSKETKKAPKLLGQVQRGATPLAALAVGANQEGEQ